MSLKDGAVLAFAFVDEELQADGFVVQWSNYDAGDESESEDVVAEGLARDKGKGRA